VAPAIVIERTTSSKSVTRLPSASVDSSVAN